jgi:nicotinate dehydrogenase subunit B
MNSELPEALQRNQLLSTWLQFDEGKVIVQTGKVELGQGISTAIAMIAAEELDVSIDQIDIKTGRTDSGPNEFITAGSMSIEGSGSAVRQVCAEARAYLLNRAADLFKVDFTELAIREGVVSNPAGNEQVSFWQLLDGHQLDFMATGETGPKAASQYSVVGHPATRIDLQAKLTGKPAFIQDLRMGNRLHARIVRPPGMAFSLSSLDFSSVEAMPGVCKVVVDGNFIGVIAETEFTAVQARRKLHRLAQWRTDPQHRLPPDIAQFLKENVEQRLLVEDGLPRESSIPPLLEAAGSVRCSATYFKPYHLHGSIGPSAAIAEFSDDHLTVYSHSQGPHVLRAAISQALVMDQDHIAVVHAENAGCYGHNGADDAAMDAAILACQYPGRPVFLQWQREDEHLWEPFSPAMLIELDACVIDGCIRTWNADVYSQTHMGRPVPFGSVTNLVAAWQKSMPMPRARARPGIALHGGIHRNADPYYLIPEKRIVKNLVTDQRVRTSSTRSLGAFANVFAIETFMNELALASGEDAVQFRLNHLQDDRGKAVITTMTDRLGEYQADTTDGLLSGRGIAFARYKNSKCYAAVGMVLSVNPETFQITLQHAVISADAGLVIDPDGLTNQLEGGLIQAASWTLKEAVQFGEFASISQNWDSYPILTFPETPTVETIILDQPREPSLGAGEATQGPTPAAISNAIFDATGIRIREIPFLPERLRSLAMREPFT